jgi:multisubunit Na+/H+ antiporter MnhF subunit
MFRRIVVAIAVGVAVALATTVVVYHVLKGVQYVTRLVARDFAGVEVLMDDDVGMTCTVLYYTGRHLPEPEDMAVVMAPVGIDVGTMVASLVYDDDAERDAGIDHILRGMYVRDAGMAVAYTTVGSSVITGFITYTDDGPYMEVWSGHVMSWED